MLGRLPGDEPGPACLSFAQIDGTDPEAGRKLDDYVQAVADGVSATPIILPVTSSPWSFRSVLGSENRDQRGP